MLNSMGCGEKGACYEKKETNAYGMHLVNVRVIKLKAITV